MVGIYRQLHLFREHLKENKIDEEVRVLDTEDLIKNQFEILSEEDEEIDIDEMEEIDLFDNGKGFSSNIDVREFYDNNFEKITNKFNELIKAVKQLNEKIKE